MNGDKDIWDWFWPMLAGIVGGATALLRKVASKRIKFNWLDVLLVGLLAIPAGWAGLTLAKAVAMDRPFDLMASWVFAYAGPEVFLLALREWTLGKTKKH